MTSTRNSPSRARPAAAPAARPRLTARSVIASTLLGLDPPELQTRALVAGAELLGVSPGTARVAMSRMVAAGELEPTGDGYRLAGRLLERRVRQDLSRSGVDDDWDGSWRTVLVAAEARPAADRADLRRALVSLRFGELREGTWLRPANLPAGLLPDAERTAADRTLTVVGRLDGGADDARALAARLWDLAGWSATADGLRGELAPLQARLDRDDAGALADAFVLAAAVLRHLQADPLLPAALLPEGWPGGELRRDHARFDRRFRAVLRAWHLARR